MRVPYEKMYNEFVRVLLKYGFDKEKAEISAKLYADASRDGVYTHGLNRFPKFIKSIHDGIVDIRAEPVLKESFGAFERYDGCHGPGNLNAYACTSVLLSWPSRTPSAVWRWLIPTLDAPGQLRPDGG